MNLLLRRFGETLINKKELLTIVFSTISILLLLWVSFSFIEVATNNMGSCEYSRLNFFTIF